MSDESFRQALVQIACMWDATGDPTTNRAANVARTALIAQTQRPTLAPLTALPDYDA